MKLNKKPAIRNFIRNIPLIISGMALMALNASSSNLLFIAIILALSFFLDETYTYWKSNLSGLIVLITLCLLIILAYSFCRSMTNSSKFQALAVLLGINIKFIVVGCALAGLIAGFYILSLLIEFVCVKVELETPKRDTSQGMTCVYTAITKGQVLFVVATAVVAITICSKSSPIYPLNDWVDANCFMTVGKSMLHGLVPYRDLFEQKGLLLYMFHAIAAMLSETTFIGVYFIEIVASIFFLFFGYKIIKVYHPAASVFLIPVLAAIVYSASNFCHGDSAEELCLPLFSFAIYIVVRSIQLDQEPTNIEYLMIGVTSSSVLWIKFSLLGFYLGWFCALAYILIRHRHLKKIISMLMMIGIGVLIPTIPILFYFGLNHALADLWTVYFYDNLFYYSSTSDHFILVSLLYNLVGGVRNLIEYSLIPAVFIGIGMLALGNKKDKTELAILICMIFFTALLVYGGGQRHKYYGFIFCSFTPVGMAAVYQTLKRWSLKYQTTDRIKTVCKYASVIACVVFTFIMCENTYLLKYSKSDMPQYQFAEIIAQTEDATLLNYGFLDGGFYTVTGIVPNCRFFCKLNIGIDEMMEEQNDCVEQGNVDFVITRDVELESELYECAAKTTFYFEGSDHEYFLYQLISAEGGSL